MQQGAGGHRQDEAHACEPLSRPWVADRINVHGHPLHLDMAMGTLYPKLGGFLLC
jgi:hypothetical protein